MRPSNIDVQAIARLADKDLNNELTELGLDIELPGNIASHLADIQSDEKEALERAAAREVYQMLNLTKEEIMKKVEHLRNIRRQETELKNEIKEIELARKFGLKTMDFRPLMSSINLIPQNYPVPKEFKEELTNTFSGASVTKTKPIARKTFSRKTTASK